MTELIDGRIIAAQLRREIAEVIKTLPKPPGLTVIRIGDDPASVIYVNAKEKACREVGINTHLLTFPDTVQEGEVLEQIQQINNDPNISGILLQLPLPKHLNAANLIGAINSTKDVDGFHPINVGLTAIGMGYAAFVPCTPAGCLHLLQVRHGRDLAGKNVVIVGRSNIVGKPLASLLLGEDCTVTVAHSRTVNLPEICRRADILVAAAGSPGLINSSFVKPGATVIDVGISRVNGKAVGDVDAAAVQGIAGALTPVPGGVGPMTVAYLLKNTLWAVQRQALR